MEFHHVSVLLPEVVDSLDIKPDGIYVDCTCGGAGHSRAILGRLGENGRLIAIDQDPDAIEIINERIGFDKRVTVINDNFSNLKAVLDSLGIDEVDGILADLGISSFQMDTPERGFSMHSDGVLDMRMSKSGISAQDVVNTFSQSDIERILRIYGEEKFARSIARNIVRERDTEPITTTGRLSEIVKYSIPASERRTGGHPARKTFMAIRIYVNDEINRLTGVLDTMFELLKPGGRLSIITFHSLEDRPVKKKFAEFCVGCICDPRAPICTCHRTPRGELPFKFKKASEEEVNSNPRSRSATLRTIVKIHN